MFGLSNETIEVIKISLQWSSAVGVIIAIVGSSIIFYDVRAGARIALNPPRRMDHDADLEHIDIALNDNIYTPS